MLNVRVVYISAPAGIPRIDRDEQGNMPLHSVREHVAALSALPDLGSYSSSGQGEGLAGCRGFVTVQTPSEVLHAYFVSDADKVGDAAIEIELFGLGSPDRESLAGLITTDTLQEILRILDSDKSPWQFARDHTIR